MLSRLSTRLMWQSTRVRAATSTLSRATPALVFRPSATAYVRSASTATESAGVEPAPKPETPSQKANKRSAPKNSNKQNDSKRIAYKKLAEVETLLEENKIAEAANRYLEIFDPSISRIIVSYESANSERLLYRLYRSIMLEHRKELVATRKQFLAERAAAKEKVANETASASEKELASSTGFPLTVKSESSLITPHQFYSKLLQASVIISWMCSEAILWDIATGKPQSGLELWVKFLEKMENLEKVNEPKCRPAAYSALAAYVMLCEAEGTPVDGNIALQMVPLKELPDDTAVTHLLRNSNSTPEDAVPSSIVKKIQAGFATIRYQELDPSSTDFLDSLPADQPLELERRYQECVKKATESKTPLSESTYARFIGCFSESSSYDRAFGVWQDMINNAPYTPTIQSWNMLLKAIALMPKNPVVAMEGLINQMQEAGVKPNSDTYGTLIHAYFQAKDPGTAMDLFNAIDAKEIDVPVNLYIYNAVLTGLMRTGNESVATDLLKSCRERDLSPNIVTFNIFISKYLEDHRYEDVSNILTLMKEYGVSPNVPTFTNYIDSIYKLSNQKGVDPTPHVENLMQTMNSLGMRTNVATITAIIDGVSKSGKNSGACMQLYRIMQKKNIRPNGKTFSALINGEILSGNLENAVFFFQEMNKFNVVQSSATYNQLFRAYSFAGMPDQIIQLFRRMLKYPYATPNKFTYTFTLRACLNSGKMDYAKEILDNLAKKPADFPLGTQLPKILQTLEEKGLAVPKFNKQ